jgi:thiamine biosynthesis protein ThiS
LLADQWTADCGSRILPWTMTIQVNGQPEQADAGETIRTLLEKRRLSPDKVAIELNRRLLKSDRYDQPLNEGDQIEIVTFVGGG